MGTAGSVISRTVLVLAILAIAGAQNTAPLPAEQAFADRLESLPEDQAHSALAAAGDAQVTAGVAKALNRAGTRFFFQHDCEKALRLYRLGTDAAVRAGDALLEADTRTNSAICMTASGMLAESLRENNRALEIYEQKNGSPERMASVLNNRATVYRHLGEFATAQDDLRRGERLARQGGDETGLARIWNNLGLVYMSQGDYRDALDVFQRSLRIAERQKEALGQSYLLNNIAELYTKEGKYPLAISYARRSLKLKEETGNKPELGTSLINLGIIYHRGGQNTEAVESLRRAAALGRESGRMTITAQALGELGQLELDRGNLTAARQNVEQSLFLYYDASERVSQARELGRLARIHLAWGDWASAVEAGNRARAMVRDSGAMPELLAASLVAGQAYMGLGQLKEARAALEEAIAVVEQMRDSVAGDDMSRQAFLEEHVAPYREMAALEIKAGRIESALRMAERAKGRALLDLLTGGRASADNVMTAAERAREAELRRRLASLAAQLAAASKTAPSDDARLRDLRGQMEKARLEQDDFRTMLYTTHPQLGARRGDPPPVGIKQAAALLPDRNSAVLEYAVTRQAVYLFVVTGTREKPSLRQYTLALTASALRRDARDFREKLSTRDPEFPEVAARLYQALLGPAQAELAGKTTLIVAPDADLWQVPFQALRSPQGRYLAQDAALFYAPSLSVLYALHQGEDAHAARSLAAFGDPAGDNPEAQREVHAVAALYGKQSRIWLGPQAREDVFRSQAGGYGLLHVAAHGVFDDRDPLRSRILLAEPGALEAGEIRQLELKARLVVLSGCETARGRFQDGEGAIGMSWAFLAAGGQAVVASQWRVESSSTTALMLEFHRELRAGVPKAQALRAATLRLMSSERFRHPFYWAAFSLFGDGY